MSACTFTVPYSCVLLLCVFHYSVSTPNYLPCIVLGFHMSTSSLPYIGFVDCSSCNTQSLVSIAWEIYAPTNKIISLQGIFLSRATNNITEYSIVIELLTNAISLGIRHFIVRLDSQLVVLQLSNVYTI
jgi:hypothetical protein